MVILYHTCVNDKVKMDIVERQKQLGGDSFHVPIGDSFIRKPRFISLYGVCHSLKNKTVMDSIWRDALEIVEHVTYEVVAFIGLDGI